MMPEAAGSAGQAQGNIDPNMMGGMNNMNQNDLMAAMLMQQQLQQQQQQQQMALQMIAQGINPMQMGMMGGMGGGDASGNAAGGMDNSQDLMLMQLHFLPQPQRRGYELARFSEHPLGLVVA